MKKLLGYLAYGRRGLLSKPLRFIGVIIIGVLGVIVLFPELLANHDPFEHDLGIRLRSPSFSNYFGTDGLGRDVFSRVVFGARVSILLGLGTSILATVFGSFIGTISVYYGGKMDLVFQRLVDSFLGFPFLLLALILVISMGASIPTMAIAITVALIPQVIRVTRVLVLSIISQPYVEAADSLGASRFNIIIKHIFPNLIPQLSVYLAGLFGAAVVGETTLSFLGLGLPPPSPSWGRMMLDGIGDYSEVAPWILGFPAVALGVLVYSTALIGDYVQEVMNPKLRNTKFRNLPS